MVGATVEAVLRVEEVLEDVVGCGGALEVY